MDYKEHYRIDALEFDYWGKDQFSPSEVRRNQYIFELCNIQPGEKVLDIGSGRGWFCQHAVGQGADVTALDLSNENLQRIKDTNPQIITVLGDACETTLPESSFDLILAAEVLEHLVDPKAAIVNWKRLLKPEGRLIVTVPYQETIRYTLCIHCNQKTPVNAHLHSFDKDGLIKLLNHHGFWVKKTELFLHKAGAVLKLNILLKWLPYKWWRKLDKFLGLFGKSYSYIALTASPKN